MHTFMAFSDVLDLGEAKNEYNTQPNIMLLYSITHKSQSF